MLYFIIFTGIYPHGMFAAGGALVPKKDLKIFEN